jgi:rhodanese-related sulfurtransferase
MEIEAVPPIDPTTLKTWLDEGRVVLIDVRESHEHAEERIAGAKLVPLSTFDPARLAAERGRHVVLHCLAGSRSARALATLAQAGFERLHNLHGGIIAWKAAGLPTVRGHG